MATRTIPQSLKRYEPGAKNDSPAQTILQWIWTACTKIMCNKAGNEPMTLALRDCSDLRGNKVLHSHLEKPGILEMPGFYFGNFFSLNFLTHAARDLTVAPFLQVIVESISKSRNGGPHSRLEFF